MKMCGAPAATFKREARQCRVLIPISAFVFVALLVIVALIVLIFLVLRAGFLSEEAGRGTKQGLQVRYVGIKADDARMLLRARHLSESDRVGRRPFRHALTKHHPTTSTAAPAAPIAASAKQFPPDV